MDRRFQRLNVATRDRSKRYTKEIDGKVEIKTANEIVIHKGGGVFFSPTEKMLLEDGWIEYFPPQPPQPPQPTEEELVEMVKQGKKDEIKTYDKSEEVNLFYIGDTAMWLDKETRTGLMLRFQAEQAIGNTDTTLWSNGVQYPLPLEVAVQMLYALEVYASACYDNTQRHLAAVDSLTTIEEIQSYDYTVGYPDKLRF
jgi:hypothetical protein